MAPGFARRLLLVGTALGLMASGCSRESAPGTAETSSIQFAAATSAAATPMPIPTGVPVLEMKTISGPSPVPVLFEHLAFFTEGKAAYQQTSPVAPRPPLVRELPRTRVEALVRDIVSHGFYLLKDAYPASRNAMMRSISLQPDRSQPGKIKTVVYPMYDVTGSIPRNLKDIDAMIVKAADETFGTAPNPYGYTPSPYGYNPGPDGYALRR